MSVEPSEQLSKYLADEAAGLMQLQERFLWQMVHEAFGSALHKLRYLRQVGLARHGSSPACDACCAAGGR